MTKFLLSTFVLLLGSLSQAQNTKYSGAVEDPAISTVIAGKTQSVLIASWNSASVPAPLGCVIGSDCTSAQKSANHNKIFYASKYPGGDIGAKINAADSAAGSGAADILVTAAGNVSTVPTITSNHRLIITVPLTWTVAPVLNSNTQIIGAGSSAMQTVHAPNAWILGRNLSNIEIDSLWVANANIPTSEGSQILACLTCSNIVMNRNYGFRIGIFRSGTTAANYAAVTNAALTTNVHLEGNRVEGSEFGPTTSPRVVTLAYLMFVKNAVLISNDAFNCEYNVEWWGGSAGEEGRTLTNPRWASQIKVSGGTAVNVVGGFWGSMGKEIEVTDVAADTCLDVCLDAESSTNVVFSEFTVRNSVNGGLATFFGSVGNEFGPGIVTSDTAASLLMFLHNVSADPLKSFNVKIHNVKFVCSDPAALCDLRVDPIGSVQFSDNELINCTLNFVQTNNSGFDISRNRFSYTFTPAAFSAIKIPGQVYNYRPISVIGGNIFASSVSQRPGTFAIDATITDANFSDILLVRDNSTQGFMSDAKFVANSRNTGISPTFIFTSNNWGADSITKSIAGTLGRFIGTK